MGPCKPCGGYEVLCDEEAEAVEKAREREEAYSNLNNNNSSALSSRYSKRPPTRGDLRTWR
jgi:hypothetical protein